MRIRASALMMALLCGSNLVAEANIVYLGEGGIPATAHDQSGLKGQLENGDTSRDQVGGLGGAIAYSGQGDFYYATPDRGPGAGETTYISRLYELVGFYSRILDIDLKTGRCASMPMPSRTPGTAYRKSWRSSIIGSWYWSATANPVQRRATRSCI